MSPPSGNTLSSSFLSSPSPSFEATLTPLPGPSLGNIPQLYSELLEDNSPQVTAMLHARRRRTRGPNKRPSGTGMKRTKRSRNPVTGFPDLLAKIPKGVRVALEANYCGDKLPLERARRRRRRRMTFRGTSTSSRTGAARACVSHHDQCKGTKAGSMTPRNGIAGIASDFGRCTGNSECDVFPVEITRREHKAIREYSTTPKIPAWRPPAWP